ncbi:hypothetical protein CTAYLR_003810 [Chrysophaeum taylorii]|uniref:subtilisin n=1 Tax=Chrysophaeum taylorii TaxID=2483200 RepID=A0AAD7UF76_9STRA|nr:hypothetical protein CTAYLR_003810 [Chrysophaeum taylorii]
MLFFFFFFMIVARAAHIAPEEYYALFGGPRIDRARTVAHHERISESEDGAVWLVGAANAEAIGCAAESLELIERGVVAQNGTLYARFYATAKIMEAAEATCRLSTATPMLADQKTAPPPAPPAEEERIGVLSSNEMELWVTYAVEFDAETVVAEFFKNESYSSELGATSGFVRSSQSLKPLAAALSKESAVATVGLSRIPHALNHDAAWTVQSNVEDSTPLWDDYGLTGEGVVISMLDSGIHFDSCYFADKEENFVTRQWSTIGSYPIWEDEEHRKILRYVAYRDATDGGSGHGTHVAGSCCGDYLADPTFQGLAPKSKLVFIDAHDAATDPSSALYVPTYTLTFAEGLDLGASLTTHSWGNGYSTNPYYHGIAKAVDDVSFDNPSLLVLMAAGNSGSAGAGTISLSASFKNGIAVGATTNSGASSLAFFSSQGPAFDNRIKPEIVAPGYSLVSASASQSCGVTSKAGTSMATPVVAGLAALIVEFFEQGYYPTGKRGESPGFTPTGALVKAMLVAMAEPLPGYDYTPNNLQGWGAVQANTVINPDADLFVEGDVSSTPRLVAGSQQIDYVFTIIDTTDSAPPPRDARFVLCWYDYPATLYSTGSILVNDLDVVAVRESDGATYYPNGGGSKDSVNTIERIIIPSADMSPGDVFTVTISASSLPYDDQTYAFVAVGDFADHDPNTTSAPTPTFEPTSQIFSCGFVGPYDISNWNVDDKRGTVDVSLLPEVLVKVSPNDGEGSGSVSVSTTAKGDGVFGFDWLYETIDAAYWDRFRVIVGATLTTLADINGANTQSGHFEQQFFRAVLGPLFHGGAGDFAASCADDDFGAGSCADDDCGAGSCADDDFGAGSRADDDFGAYPRADDDFGAYPRADDDFGAYPRADDAGAHPRADDVATHPRADDDGTHPRADNAGAYPRADDAGAYPRADDFATHPRADDFATHPRAKFSSTNPRADDSPIHADGDLLATYTPPQPLATGPHQDLVIGHVEGGGIPSSAILGWVGAIDDVMVFGKALSTAEIDELYDLTVTGERTEVSSCSRFELRYKDADGRLYFVSSPGSDPVCNKQFRSKKVPNPSDWHFLCVGYDGSDVAVHADGDLLATYTPPQPLATGPHRDLVIGHFEGGGIPSSEFLGWVGAIDDVMIFGKALSTAEIDDLYDFTVEGTFPAACAFHDTSASS